MADFLYLRMSYILRNFTKCKTSVSYTFLLAFLNDWADSAFCPTCIGSCVMADFLYRRMSNNLLENWRLFNIRALRVSARLPCARPNHSLDLHETYLAYSIHTTASTHAVLYNSNQYFAGAQGKRATARFQVLVHLPCARLNRSLDLHETCLAYRKHKTASTHAVLYDSSK